MEVNKTFTTTLLGKPDLEHAPVMQLLRRQNFGTMWVQYQLRKLVQWKLETGNSVMVGSLHDHLYFSTIRNLINLIRFFSSLFHNVEKWPNILSKSCGVHTASLLKYVWLFSTL